jgi:DNA-directed RNA polymerase subunit N (RpoN/RPB10)
MASILKVDKLDPQSGTALEIGTSGDTVTVPSGATLTTTDATLNLPTTITSTTEVKTNKVSPATGTAFALGDSGDTFTVPSGATIVNSGTATGFGITSSSFLPTAAPLIINGDMQVAQRGTSKTSISTGVHGYWTCDRFRERNDTGGTWTQTQESLTSGDALADGFANSLKMDNTTANASLSATSRLYLNYAFEGQDVQVFKKGTANAEKYTVSFWVKATKTGTNILELWDNGGTTRHCCTAYTISSTDTWEKKVVNFPADTTGVIADGSSDNFIMYFWLAAGTNYTSGTLATTWANTTAANSAVGQVNNADSTSNNFEITGVQLEVGEYTSSDLPPFRFESYGNNLRRCQRYFETTFTVGQVPGVSTDASSSRLNTSWGDGNVPLPGGGMFKVEKRAAPTMVLYARSGTTEGQLQSYGTPRSAVATDVGTGGVAYCTVTSGTANAYSGGCWTADAEL